MIEAQLANVEDVVRYVTGGNATFTLKSLKTGTRYTYRVQPPNRPPRNTNKKVFWVLHLTGPDNEQDYHYLGALFHTDRSMKFVAKQHITSTTVFAWFVELLNQNKLHDLLEFWHSGRCSRCGRLLTTPESVARGIGPVCMNKQV